MKIPSLQDHNATFNCYYGKFKETNEIKKAVNSRSTDNTMAEIKITKGQRIIYKTLYCCLRARRTPVQIGVNSCASVS
jgi:hypothetical protein